MQSPVRVWWAVLLSGLVSPLGMLYLRRPGWAGTYLLALLGLGALSLLMPPSPALGVGQALLMLTAAVHAFSLARSVPQPRPHYSRWYGLLGIAAFALALQFALRAFLFEPFRMPSTSMEPTIPLNAKLIVKKWGHGHYASLGLTLAQRPASEPLTRGELIVFVHPGNGQHYVQRLVGLPGDRLLLNGDLLQLNGEVIQRQAAGWYTDAESGQSLAVSTEWLDGSSHQVIAMGSASFPPMNLKTTSFQNACQPVASGVECVVPSGHYFTLGDHRPNSADGRVWGFLSAAKVLGSVVFIGPKANG